MQMQQNIRYSNLRHTRQSIKVHRTTILPQVECNATKTVTVEPQTMTATAFSVELDEKYKRLANNKEAWRTMAIPAKIKLLKEVRGRVLNDMYSWGKAGAALRGLANDKWAIAENTLISPIVINRYIGTLIDTLESIDKQGKCPEVEIRTTPSGQLVAQAYPGKGKKGDTVSELYIQPGKPASQGAVYLGKEPQGGKVTAMLGAGNVGFLGVKDALYALFECNNVVMFKPHPIQADWHRFADVLLEPLHKAGVYESVYTNDIKETQQMLYHPSVEHVHMTGGIATHDAIVWGADPAEQARRKAENDPVLKVPITSELGCITPWIVTGGDWSEKQLEAQALNAVNGVYFNNSCACNSLKVLVLPQSWSQADTFLAKIKETLKKLPLQPAWYPGHNQRYNAWKAVFPDAESVAGPVAPASKDFDGAQPMPFLIQEVPFPEPGQELTEQQKYAFTVEPFAPVMTVVRVPASSPQDYMQKATNFANDTLWGTLSCTVLLHPDVEKDYPEDCQKMLDELRYGSVVVNAYSGAAYSTPHTIWGAYGGHQTLDNVGSGMGAINNTLFFDHPQKSVVRLPFVSSATPKPLELTGLPAWAFGPLGGLLVGGLPGLARAIFSRK